jgi:hypothetical protein
MALERHRLTDEIAAALQQKITEMGLQEGDKMPSHSVLAEDLSISIPSLREGLQVLSTLGIIRLEHGRGTIVSRPSISDYAGSVDPSLLSRSYSLDESISVLITALNSLSEDFCRTQRREYPLEPVLEKLRSVTTPLGAAITIGEFYRVLVAPLKRPLTSDIIMLTVKLILSAPYLMESIHLRSEEFGNTFFNFLRVMEESDADAVRNLIKEQEKLLRSLVPVERRLSCVTGSIGGTFYSAGLELESALRDHSGVLLRVKPTAGGIENLLLLGEGKTDIAFTQAHVAQAACNGEEPFNKPMKDISVICRTHSLDLWIVTAFSSGIADLKSLRGKRVSLGTRGGETSRIAAEILNAYGHDGSSMEQRFLSISQAAEALSRGEIDILFYLTGGMGTALSRLSETHDLRVIGIDPEILKGICESEPSWIPSTVSADSQEEGVPTVRVETLLVCRSSLAADRVAEVRRALDLAAKTSLILDPAVPENLDSLPLHPGVLNV